MLHIFVPPSDLLRYLLLCILRPVCRPLLSLKGTEGVWKQYGRFLTPHKVTKKTLRLGRVTVPGTSETDVGDAKIVVARVLVGSKVAEHGD